MYTVCRYIAYSSTKVSLFVSRSPKFGVVGGISTRLRRGVSEIANLHFLDIACIVQAHAAISSRVLPMVDGGWGVLQDSNITWIGYHLVFGAGDLAAPPSHHGRRAARTGHDTASLTTAHNARFDACHCTVSMPLMRTDYARANLSRRRRTHHSIMIMRADR